VPQKKIKLLITPQPYSILRVFIVFKGLDKYIELEEPEIEVFERKGTSKIFIISFFIIFLYCAL